MSQLKITKIILKDFKGFHEKEYTASQIEKMKQPNGTGKTTVATAIMWTLFDKGYELNSNPNIRPNDEVENEFVPTVTLLFDLDGTEITFAKMQKKSLSKPDEKGIRKVTLTNSYEINSVPKREADIKPFFAEHGIDSDILLACMHPDVFTSQKAVDMRNILFKMAKNHADIDIAKEHDETKELATLLEKYKLDEIEAMYKASREKAHAEVEKIPNEIIGMESSKVDIDVAELELQKNELEKQITDAKSNVVVGVDKKSELEQQLFRLEFDKNGIVQRENDKLILERRKFKSKLADKQAILSQKERKIALCKADIDNLNQSITRKTEEKDNLLAQWKAENAKVFDESVWQFDEKSTICPNCGQNYPEDKISELKNSFESRKLLAKTEFEKNKAIIIDRIVSDGKQKRVEIDKMSESVKSYETEIADTQKIIVQLNDEIGQLTGKIALIQSEPHMELIPGYVEIVDKMEELKKQIAEIPEKVEEDADDQLQELENQLSNVIMQIGSFANNARIDENIAQRRKDLRDYEQTKSDAERILDEIKALSRIKNDLLSDEINAHFSKVTWKLWELQKNGGYKDVCIPLIDGYEFGRSTNTGREILAKIDICDSLQKFYGHKLPIVVDKAESLNESNYPQVETQLIMLSVGE